MPVLFDQLLPFLASAFASFAPAAPVPAASPTVAVISVADWMASTPLVASPAVVVKAPVPAKRVPAKPVVALPVVPAAASGGVIAAPAPAPIVIAAAPTADEVLASVQQFYAGIKQVTAKFSQEVKNETFGSTKTSNGKVWIAKPGKMRWDYYAKPRKGKVATKKSFVSNGDYLYVVEYDNKQVLKKNLQQDLMPVAISFLYGQGDLRADFTGALDTTGTYGDKTDVVLKLTPKKPSTQYKFLYLVVDPTMYRVKQSIIIDSSNNVNHFRFYEPDFERTIEAKWFEFNPASLPTFKVVNADEAGMKAPTTTPPSATAPVAPKKP